MVDKTEYIWKLIFEAPAFFFMSRPCRFGKSLTVSTLKAVFQGNKKLFKGLAIYDKPYDWKEYPVIHLDMANCIDPLSLLLQTGYLSIKSMEKKFNMPWYWLDFPNQKVSVFFNTYRLNACAGKSKNDVTNFCERLADAMVKGNIELLRKALEAFFAGIPV